VNDEQKRDVINRLKRIEGQVKGVQRMIEEDKCCADTLDQIAAARAALYNAGVLLLERHARDCVMEAMAEGGEGEVIDELVRVIKKFARS
jgi:DNA-binding FrmR family transcriptional regulator